MAYVAPIVEGHGEVEALPALLHRIARLAGFEGTLRVNPPIRVKSGSFIHDDPVVHQVEFSRKFDLDAARANPSFDRFYRHICRLLEGTQDM